MIGMIGKIFRLPFTFTSVLQALAIWMARCNSNSQYGLCRLVVAAYIFRELWVARCLATYEDAPRNSRSICRKITHRVQLLNLVHDPKKSSSNRHLCIVEILGINRRPPRSRRGLWCKWDKLSPGWFKLNIDGSARSGESSGGGIIRTDNGVFIVAFSHFYGDQTNNMAEFLAVKDGLILCSRYYRKRFYSGGLGR